MARELGEYAVAAASDTFLVQSNTGGNCGDIVRLAGARLVTASEICPARNGTADHQADHRRRHNCSGREVRIRDRAARPSCSSRRRTIAHDPGDDDDGLGRMRRAPLVAQIPPDEQDRAEGTTRSPEHAAGFWHGPSKAAWIATTRARFAPPSRRPTRNTFRIGHGRSRAVSSTSAACLSRKRLSHARCSTEGTSSVVPTPASGTSARETRQRPSNGDAENELCAGIGNGLGRLRRGGFVLGD